MTDDEAKVMQHRLADEWSTTQKYFPFVEPAAQPEQWRVVYTMLRGAGLDRLGGMLTVPRERTWWTLWLGYENDELYRLRLVNEVLRRRIHGA